MAEITIAQIVEGRDGDDIEIEKAERAVPILKAKAKSL